MEFLRISVLKFKWASYAYQINTVSNKPKWIILRLVDFKWKNLEGQRE
jgi:hypothetical protein